MPTHYDPFDVAGFSNTTQDSTISSPYAHEQSSSLNWDKEASANIIIPYVEESFPTNISFVGTNPSHMKSWYFNNLYDS